MSERPASRSPGQGDDPPGTPAGPGDRPSPGAPGWRLVLAQAREVTAEQARAAEIWARLGLAAVVAALGAVSAGRRGPGMRELAPIPDSSHPATRPTRPTVIRSSSTSYTTRYGPTCSR